MSEQLRIDVAGLQTMAARWGGLDTTPAALPAALGPSCQASAAAVNAAHADVTAFTTALAARVGDHSARVVAADNLYVANEAGSAGELASLTCAVVGV